MPDAPRYLLAVSVVAIASALAVSACVVETKHPFPTEDTAGGGGADAGTATAPYGDDSGSVTSPGTTPSTSSSPGGSDAGTGVPTTPATSDSGATPGPDSGAGAPDSTPPAPPPAPPYPAGPYGLDTGKVFPPLVLSGYRNGAGAWTKMSMQDYYDPTGSRGIKGIYIDVSAEWCGACQDEAAALPGLLRSTYSARGARLVTAMIQDSGGSPADQSTVDRWIRAFHTNFDIVADPSSDTLPSSGGVGLPHNYVIDPRTMKIDSIVEGSYGTSNIPELDVVLTRNGG